MLLVILGMIGGGLYLMAQDTKLQVERRVEGRTGIRTIGEILLVCGGLCLLGLLFG